MEITFLGTGTSQGIPIIGSDHPVCLSNDPKDKRLRVSILVEWENYTYVVDCGPDFRQQMLANKVEKIDGILLTHEHNDHIIGLDDVRPFYFKQGDISVYAHPRVIKALKKRFDYVFETVNKYPGTPTLAIVELNDNPFQIGNLEVVPVNVWHHKLQVYAFRLGDFAYVTDAKTIDEEELEKLKGVKVLTVNALRKEPHLSHFNLEEALDFIRKINPERAYLTHISHLMGFHEEVEKELPENVFLAYDNLKITI
ncbi:MULTISPECIES: MBL fold metallo-hydrolase [Mesonia]|uniref:Phosphoribosyl 1,2-cyclic phosphate phosphodiesterase n=1 Tax=Mesonia oceanica TaxID=2687242 RepID=A0AC61YC72_9FLAO|nr:MULTISPECIES: MBL fold metallo-hydrolase [Mesonia]MAN27105.1 MBL fold metallo-hydrolase [Mesonia sp.]MAQ41992.1 MBL fold metallo-hydrolase [Mesonia sp.]MBJ97653.1 MBL fold metallo-hydrolase [Flavobacteriaceae bacterium]VVV02092.1 Phosphoribosyl 1,2-cyclic phosphate phosphodiesterase [Mesonia oceanica]